MAVSPAVIKLIITAATDKRTWKVVAIIIATLLLPFILLIVMLAGMVSGVQSANNNLLDYCFKGGSISQEFTDEQQEIIENMRSWLGDLDEVIIEKENNGEDSSLDGNMVRAAFYCLNFSGELGEDFDYEQFCECFDGLSFYQLETALQVVSEKFPQYEMTGNAAQYIKTVYDYLNGEVT